MKIKCILTSLLISFTWCGWSQVPSRAPLQQNPYMELPLGAIKPQGWLREMLIRQKGGATGNLDKLYPLVMGPRNGWLGGDGDQWERGPYWLDGLLPLAYLLQDKELIAKTQPWIEYAIKSQQPDGYFGPSKDYGPEPGIQRDNSHDWWPKMVMLKVLQQYYNATGDKRIITLLTKYFQYQLKELPAKPLDHWSFWARYREGDNLMVVYWLYNITGDKFLLDLADLLHRQGFDYTHAFLDTDLLSRNNSIHGVNLAQGMKEPILYYQQHHDARYPEALKKGYADLQRFSGMANGMYGADESLHGNNPTQGSELCTAVEMMFTLENTLVITGDVDYADRLEKIAFNALPAQASADYSTRQYFQQANQVMITRHDRNFDVNHNGTDLCYGLLTGYACCTSNMHQGWPKFAQNLWYATPDKGLAALVYSPSEVTATVADGVRVTLAEETGYPFRETIRFRLTELAKTVAFPLTLRIPSWCWQGVITINGAPFQQSPGGQVVKIQRVWKKGDVVELSLPMHLFKNTWYENSVSIERGPLTYALRIGEESKVVVNDKDPVAYGAKYEEIRPTTPWNYGLESAAVEAVPPPGKEKTDAGAGMSGAGKDKPEDHFTLEVRDTLARYPWTLDGAPILLKTTGRLISSWQLYNEMAGPNPYSDSYNEGVPRQKEEEIILVPYGCTRLRISEFPLVRTLSSAQPPDSTYAERLGFPKGSRVLILHVDDAGMSYESNAGAIAALTRGAANSVSVMMPCPWVPGFVQWLKLHPGTDAGLHLTLTSEWKAYRWVPLAGRKAVPGLVDSAGCFWPGISQVAQHASPDEIELEMTAQLERARAMGFEPTHLDTHMGTVYSTPDYLTRYMRLGMKQHIPVMLPGGADKLIQEQTGLTDQAIGQMRLLGKTLWEAGLPVLDDLHNFSYDWKVPDSVASDDQKLQRYRSAEYIDALKSLQPGVTMMIMHCTDASPAFANISDSGPLRRGDMLAMMNPAFKAALKDQHIILTTWRELMQRRTKIAN